MRRADILSVVILIILGSALVLPFLISDIALEPFRLDAHIEPWSTGASTDLADEPANFVMSEKTAYLHPNMEFARREIAEGRMPLWNPHTYAGLPHAADPMAALFYPPHLVYLFIDDLQLGFVILMAFHCLLAALFTFAYLRTVGVGSGSSLVGAIAFAFGGWMAVHVHHPWLMHAMVWLPLALLSIERILRDRPKWALVTLAIGLGTGFLAGFPQTAVINVYVIAIYAVVAFIGRLIVVAQDEGVEGLIDDGLRRGGIMLIFALLGLALAAVQLGPTLDWKRDVGHQDQSLDELKGDALWPESLVHVISPDIFGSPTDEMRTDVLERLFLSVEGQRLSNNYSERTFYAGTLILLLALCAPFLRFNRVTLTLAMGTVLALLIALATPVFDLSAKFPGLNFGSPMRFVQVAAFAIPCLGAIGLDAFFARWENKGPTTLRMVCVFSALILGPLIVIMMAAWIAPHWLNRFWTDWLVDFGAAERFGVADRDRDYLEAVALQPFFQLRFALTMTLAFLTGAAAFFVLWSHPRASRRWALALAFGLTLTELMLFGIRFNRPVTSVDIENLSSPGIVFLQENLGDARIVRIGDQKEIGNFFMQNMPVVYGLNDVHGYRAMSPQSYLDFMRTVEANPFDAALPSLADPKSLDATQLDLLRVRYAISPVSRSDVTWKQVYPPADQTSEADMWIYENPRPLLDRAYIVREVEALTDEGVLSELSRLRKEKDDTTLRKRVLVRELGPQLRSRYIAPSQPDRVVITKDEPGHLIFDVETESAGVLVVSEQFQGSWRALIHRASMGKPDAEALTIARANHTFMAVPIAAGWQRIELRYDPASYRWCGLLSGFVLVFLLLVPILPILAVKRRELITYEDGERVI